MRRARSASMPFSIAVAFTAAALAVTLCACTSGGGSSDADGGSTTAAPSATAAPSGDFGASLDAALENARGCDISQGEGYEWVALSLARASDAESRTSLGGFADAMEERARACGGVLDEHSSTEYSKTILALTAVGRDARDVAGYDLFEGLADMGFVEMQGINGPIWALIALDCSPAYGIPGTDVDSPASRDALVAAVLEGQGDDGGWPYTGDPADPGVVDLTAMALTALSPYAGDDGRDDARAAVERGLDFLSAAQEPDGGFVGEDGDEASESAAQAVIAICSLGIDPDTDERFVKEGGSLLDNLLSYQTRDGGFSHLLGDEHADDVASDQALEALVAVQRLRSGQASLYDMGDVLPE